MSRSEVSCAFLVLLMAAFSIQTVMNPLNEQDFKTVRKLFSKPLSNSEEGETVDEEDLKDWVKRSDYTDYTSSSEEEEITSEVPSPYFIDYDFIVDPTERNIIAYENETVLIPCARTNHRVNMTLHKGPYSWRMRPLYLGMQPYRNQNLTYDPTKGFFLQPVTRLDADSYKCIAKELWTYNTESIIFTLDVNSAHLLIHRAERKFITQKYKKVLLPCQPNTPDVNVTLYDISYSTTMISVGLQTTHAQFQNVSYNAFEGFTFDTVNYGDDGTYKCVATQGALKDSMYFYLHVDQVHSLSAPEHHYIFGYEGNSIIVPCKPASSGIEVHLLHTTVTEIRPGDKTRCNQDIKYDPNVGYTINKTNTTDSGEYKCTGGSGADIETITFYVYVNKGNLMNTIDNRNKIADTKTTATLPCIAKNADINVSLYEEIYQGFMREVSTDRNSYLSTKLITHDPTYGFIMSSLRDNDYHHYQCRATYGNEEESLDFYLRGGTTLFRTVSRNIVAKIGDYVVIPCEAISVETKVTLYKGRSYYRQREIHLGRQPHSNQTVTYNYLVGFTLNPVGVLDYGWFKCSGKRVITTENIEFFVDVQTAPNITNTNLGKNLTAKTGDNLTISCEADGKPFPETVWSKNGKPVVPDDHVKLSERNQTLSIKSVTMEHEGLYRCVVNNSLGQVKAEGNFTLTDGPPSEIETNLKKDRKLEANLGRHFTIFCKSYGKPQPEITWLKDGKPIIGDSTMELKERNQILTIKVMKSEQKGKYSCIVKNKLGEERAEGDVGVNASDAVPQTADETSLIGNENLKVKLGSNVNLFCKSQGNSMPQTLWFKDGKPVNPDNTMELKDRNQTLNIKVVKMEHKGTYECVVRNEQKDDVHEQRTLDIIDAEQSRIVNTNLNQNLSAQLGRNLTLFCKSKGNPEPKTLWFKDDLLMNSNDATLSERNQTMIIKMVTLEHKGTYKCTVKNDLGEVQAEGAVNITEPVTIIATNLNASEKIGAEIGGNLTIFCRTQGSPIPKIYWYKDGKPLILDNTMTLKDKNQTLIIKEVKMDNKGTYRCVVENKLGKAQMVGSVNITDESTGMSSAAIVTITIVSVLLLVAIIGALLLYIRRNGSYRQLSRPEEEHSIFNDRLQEEYLRTPHSGVRREEQGDLVDSECPPGSSRPALEFSDDGNNTSSTTRVNGESAYTIKVPKQHSVEMRNLE